MRDERQINEGCDWNYLRLHLDKPRTHGINALGMGLSGWLLGRWQTFTSAAPQLELIERISLGTRHGVALIRANGAFVLVGTSTDGGTSFLPLLTSPSDGHDKTALAHLGTAATPSDQNRLSSGPLLSNLLDRAGRQDRRLRSLSRISW